MHEKGLSVIRNRLAWWVLCLSFCVLQGEATANGGSPLRKQATRVDVKVVVERILHLGENAYRIETAVVNKSGGKIQIQAVKKQFAVQTEQGWKTLEERVIENSFSGRDQNILPRQEREMVTVIAIPLNLPDLFRTYEGDVSLRLGYTIRFSVGRNTPVFDKDGEEYYWISPLTDRWIHREGM